MKKLLSSGVVIAVSLFGAAAPALADVCLDIRDIKSTVAQNNGKEMLFTMKNGAVWRNKLQGQCPDLMFNGFSWVIRDPLQRVCENSQTFKVLQSAEICTLGKFTQIKPPKSG